MYVCNMIFTVLKYVDNQAKQFMRTYLQAKGNLGSERLKLLKVLIFGPPGAGKSTLLKVLLEDTNANLPRESTGLFKQKLVQFKIAVEKIDTKSKSQWKVLSINDEIRRLQQIIERKLESNCQPNNIEKILDLKMDDKNLDIKIDDKNLDMKVDEKILESAKDKEIFSNFTTLITQVDQTITQEYYQTSNTLMVCYDSGGQSEFFDVMPALTTSTTGNILVFDMSTDLHSKLDPDYYKKGKPWNTTGVKTHYSSIQLMKTALANIQSYSSSCSNSNVIIPPVMNQLLVVGTHLDQCGNTKDEICEKMLEVEKMIDDNILHDCSSILVIERKKNPNSIFPISCTNNDNERDEAAQEIRTAIENMSENNSVLSDIPINWLIFQYEIKLLGESDPIVLRTKCNEIATKCYIKEEQIDEILLFFHELGILLYYKDVENLGHVIFSNPQWLFDQLTNIIELKYNPPHKAKKQICKGIFTTQILSEFNGENFNTNNLKFEDLLNLFVSLNIIAILPDTVDEYFMPAFLDAAPNTDSMLMQYGKRVFDILHIKYEDRFFPRGVFCCLIALSAKDKAWKIQFNTVYKDLVVFQIGHNKEYIVLSDKINSISVEIYHDGDMDLQNSHQVLCCKLFNNLIVVCSNLHLDKYFEFGFLCENCKPLERICSVQIQYPFYPEALHCKECNSSVEMSYDQLVWFIPPNVIHKLSKQVSIVHSCICI